MDMWVLALYCVYNIYIYTYNFIYTEYKWHEMKKQLGDMQNPPSQAPSETNTLWSREPSLSRSLLLRCRTPQPTTARPNSHFTLWKACVRTPRCSGDQNGLGKTPRISFSDIFRYYLDPPFLEFFRYFGSLQGGDWWTPPGTTWFISSINCRYIDHKPKLLEHIGLS